MKGESWLTVASNDIEAWKAIVLAKSLRGVFTSKPITIGITEDVSQEFRTTLHKIFDAVLPIYSSEIGNIKEGTKEFKSAWLKIWCWKLGLLKKCIFIDPNSLVLENVDELFSRYDQFSTFYCDRASNGLIMDSAIFVLRPNMDTFDSLIECTKKLAKPLVENIFHSFFNKSNLITKIDETFYNNEFALQDEFPKIIHFCSQPWDKNKDGCKLEFAIKDAKKKWLQLFVHKVTPLIHSQKPQVKNFLIDSIQQFGIPTSNGPAKQVENVSLGDLEDSIAVVGIAGKFPGANNIEEFWDLLVSGIDPICKLPKGRPSLSVVDDREVGYLKCPIDEFDAKFFGISPRDAEIIDPQQRILLETIWESLENASINPQDLYFSNTSMFLGIWQADYEHHLAAMDLTEDAILRKYLGNAFSATAARISNFLGLFGPNVVTESGCSSSASALHFACKSLRASETNMAIVGGVNLILATDSILGSSSSNSPVAAKNYRCKTFDESADGFGGAEGCAAIILKRYSDARYDGDKILGIIRGTSLNNDGPGTAFGTPNAIAQERVFREALKEANISPAEVSYIEAHGTGTATGDPIEVQAIGRVYGRRQKDQPLLISSVKTNIGHTESCAGLAGLIKILLSMKHKVIPPHLHLKNLNSRIDFDSIPAKIPTKVTEWNVEDGKSRIAGLNSFSMSGTNVHAIVQEPPVGTEVVPIITHPGMPQMVQMSAKSQVALEELVARYVEYLETINPCEMSLDDFAYHTNVGRASLPYRLTVVANDTTQLLEKLKNKFYNSGKIPVQKTKVGFLFTGQGSQYFGMAKKLYEKFPNFKIPFDQCDYLIQEELGLSLREIVWGKSEHLERSINCQPAIFSIEYSLVQFWKSLGIEPDYVLGHSVGEFAAATTAGVLSLQDAMTLVIQRSKLVDGLGRGSMLVVRASEGVTDNMIRQFRSNFDLWIDIAAINSEEEVVVSGPEESIRLFAQFILKSGIKSQELKAETAFHSREMEPVLRKFGLIVRDQIKVHEPKCKYISGTLGKLMDSASEFGPDYWVRHFRDTVRFSESIKLVWQECKILVEIGAQPILLGLAMANVSDHQSGSFIPVLRKNEDDIQATFSALSKLFLTGIKIDWKQWFGRRQKKLTLPTYPFQRQKFWVNSQEDETENEFMDLSPPHPLLGKMLPVPVADQIFNQKFQLKELEYIKDHKVVSKIILPAAAYLEMMLAAAQQVVTRGNGMTLPLTIENFNIEAALELDKAYHVQTVVSPEQQPDSEENNSLQYRVSVQRQIGTHKWKRHAVGSFKPNSNVPGQTSFDLDRIKGRNVVNDDLETLYKEIWETGIQFGPKFKSIISAWIGQNEALTKINLPAESQHYICHPIILDAMIQTLLFRFGNGITVDNENFMRLPIGIRKFIHLPNETSNELYIYTNWEAGDERLFLLNASGVCLGIMDGIEWVKTTKHSFIRKLNEEKLDIPCLLEETWVAKTNVLTKRVDPELFQIPTINSNHVSKSKGIQVPEKMKETVQYAFDQCFLYFLVRGIQECGWKWPEVGGVIRPEEWFSFSQKHLKHVGLFNYFLEVLVNENYLIRPNPELFEFQVIRNLLPLNECQLKIEQFLNILHENDEPSALFTSRCDACFTNVLSGRMSTLEYMFPEDPKEYGAVKFYNESLWYDSLSEISMAMILDAVEPLICQKNMGVLRILEVGAGSGKSSAQLMEKLKQLNIPFHYTFTDISQAFLTEASKKFDSKIVTFGILNIEKDPLAQGYSPESFDIILAAQVIHATSNIEESFKGCNQLLRKGGIIVLSEQFKPTYSITLSFGFLDGWWNFNDFRKSSPILTAQEWENCLNDAGFEGTRFVPFVPGISGAVVSRKIKLSSPTKDTELKSWIMFSDNPNLSKIYVENFKKYGRQVITLKYDMDISEMKIHSEQNVYRINPKNKSQMYNLMQNLQNEFNIEGILYIWTENHDEYSIQERQEIYCGGLLHLCQAVIKVNETKKLNPKFNFITKGLHNFGDESYGPVDSSTAWALLKVLINETGFHVNLFDLSEEMLLNHQENEALFAKLWNSDKDYFVAVRGGKTFVKRLVNVDKKIVPLSLPNSNRFKAVNPKTNSLKDILISTAIKRELKDNEVEVSVKAASMNFRDLFLVLKPEGFDLPESMELGFDISGVVNAVGCKVTRFKQGDEVFGISCGGYASHSVVFENQLFKKPPSMSFTSASTMGCAGLTVFYSLITCAKMNSKDRVLIHAATGGVGLTAIQYAKLAGVEIFATAGSKKKRTYLQNLGIKHVYHSRNTDFAEQILNDTNGEGVSIVLNSLTGPGFKEASLKTCGKGARFVEIGKVNIWTKEEVRALRPDMEYFAVDISEDLNDKIEFFDNFDKFFHEIESQGISFGLPHVTYPLDLIHEAFQRFQETKHIGKIVVKIPRAILTSNGNWQFVHEIFDSDSTYLITGGLGGIGLEMVRWMTGLGAKHILLVGRSLPTVKAEEIITQLNMLGSNIIPIQADVSDYTQCSGILDTIRSKGLPSLRGIFHGAGVLSDAFISNQSWDKFAHVFSSKIYAAWNLHNLTLGYDLEYFVSFSSGTVVLGNPGQSNHCAANTYLDALTHYRRSIGLPAQTINFGAWSDIGAAAHMAWGTEGLYGMKAFTPRQGINGIEKILREKHTQLVVFGETDWSILKQYIKLGNYFERLQSQQSVTSLDISEIVSNMIEKVKKSKPEERKEELKKFLEILLKKLLRLAEDEKIEKDQNFAELGVDSLIGMEMKNYLQCLFTTQTLSITSMENNRTIEALSEHLTYLMNSEDQEMGVKVENVV